MLVEDVLRRLWRAVFISRAKTSLPAGVGPECYLGDRVAVINSTFAGNDEIDDDVRVFESVVDRWVHLQSGVTLSLSNVGSFSYLARNSYVTKSTIGRFCAIGPNVVCGCGDHPTSWISHSPAFYSTRRQCGVSFVDENHFSELEPVRIGNDVWLGANAVVRNGICIGHGAIVAAGAVVTKDVPAYSVVAGVPAKVIKFRFEAVTIKRLIACEWWNLPIPVLRAEAHRWRTENTEEFLTWAESVVKSSSREVDV